MPDLSVHIVPKNVWNTTQIEQVAAYRNDPIHAQDTGPIRVDYERGMYAATFEDGRVFGIIEASGPMNRVSPGWWIAKRYRGKRLGTPMVVALARALRKEGYTGIGEIKIKTRNGVYDNESSKLRDHFVEEFNAE